MWWSVAWPRFISADLLGAGQRDIVLLRDIGKLASASMIAGTVCSILRSSPGAAGPLVVLAACGIVFAVVYLFAIYFLRVLSAEGRGPAREFAARRLPVPWRYRLD